MRGGSMPTSESPPIGSQSSVRAEEQKQHQPEPEDRHRDAEEREGHRHVVEGAAGPERGEDADRHADERRERKGREGELQGHREGGAHIREGRAIARERGAEIAMRRRSDEAQILDDDRLVEPELKAKLRQLLGRAAIAEQEHRHVARQHMHGEEHDDADPDEHDGELDEAPADIAPKLGSIASPARAHADPGKRTGHASRFDRHQGLIMGSAPREEGFAKLVLGRHS